jgi:hypothetical protein
MHKGGWPKPKALQTHVYARMYSNAQGYHHTYGFIRCVSTYIWLYAVRRYGSCQQPKLVSERDRLSWRLTAMIPC